MRIAIDIDSTLHPYWPQLSDAARRRFGIELPYEEQLTWGITRLKPEQLKLCIDETHRDDSILALRALPGRRGDRERLARAPVTSSTSPATARRAATRRTSTWLRAHRPGLRRALLQLRQGQPLLRDRDRPADRRQPAQPRGRAVGAGIAAATIEHPWNRGRRRGGGHHQRRRLARAAPSAWRRPWSRCAPGLRAPRGASAGAVRGRRHDGRRHPHPAAHPERRRAREHRDPPPAPSRPRCPPSPRRTRRYLPGIEPERQVDDWGRSERVEDAFDRDARRLLLPPVVPLRGGGRSSTCPDDGRRPAGLQPLRRAAARRRDDRQGDQGGAPASRGR